MKAAKSRNYWLIFLIAFLKLGETDFVCATGALGISPCFNTWKQILCFDGIMITSEC